MFVGRSDHYTGVRALRCSGVWFPVGCRLPMCVVSRSAVCVGNR